MHGAQCFLKWLPKTYPNRSSFSLRFNSILINALIDIPFIKTQYPQNLTFEKIISSCLMANFTIMFTFFLITWLYRYPVWSSTKASWWTQDSLRFSDYSLPNSTASSSTMSTCFSKTAATSIRAPKWTRCI